MGIQLRTLSVLLGLFVFSIPGISQTFRGSISGSIADSSNSAIPGATVKIENNGTGISRSQDATSSGDFTFPDLQPGMYTVTVSHQGFQTQQIANVEVQVGRVASLTITLGVAQQTQTVEVQAAAAAIDTTTSVLNAVVNTRAVQEIPLNGRDFRQLLHLTPGYNDAGSSNGNRPNQNNWQIDGVDNNDFWHNAEAVNQGSISGVAGVLLPIDAIDQFNQQSNGGADFGRNPGSMVNVAIKTGTNTFHGTAYYFNRNEALAAKSPFSPVNQANPELRNQNYGFSLGGPIIRNKTFFFLTYEHQKFIGGNQLQATVPSDAWVAATTPVLAKYQIAVNPVMLNILNNLWPASIRGAAATGPNFFSSDKNDYKSDNGIIRLDHNFNERHSIFARAFLGTGEATAFAGSVYRPYFQSVPSRQHNFSVVENSVLTPRLVNQVLVGVNYFFQAFDDADHGRNPIALGLNTGSAVSGTPNIEISGFNNGGVGETPRLGRIDVTGHVTDNLSYNLGSHALKFGGEFRRARLDVFYNRDLRGAFNFDGSAGPWAGDKSFTDTQRAFADFLGGYIAPGNASIATGDPQRVYYVNSFEWWAQDNWQVSPRLNVNYGVRYAFNGRIHEDGSKGLSIFSPTAPGGFAFDGKDIQGLYPKDLNNFGPRMGFAFSPKRGGRTVIRGSWGVYYDIPNGNLFIDNRAGSDAGRGFSRNPAGQAPVFGISNPNLVVVRKDELIFGSAKPIPPFAAFTINQDLRSPYVQNFSFNVQQQLTQNMLFQIGYVGSQGRKLLVTRNINQPFPTASTAVPLQQRRPYFAQFPDLSGITEISSSADSQYNSLQLTLRNTSWHGLSGQLSYTLGHARDEMSSPRNNRPTDNNDLRRDYSNADFDTRNNVSAYLLYDVPRFGKTLPLLTQGWQLNTYFTYDSGFPFSVLAGTNVSNTNNRNDKADIVGDPFSAVVQPARPNGTLVNGVAWFNPAAFKAPAPGTFGTSKRNQFYGPEFRSVDFSVFKNTPITEKVRAQLRLEIFNLFNSVNLGGPDSTINSSTAGLIFGTRHGGDSPGIGAGEPRNVQLALKIIF